MIFQTFLGTITPYFWWCYCLYCFRTRFDWT